MAIKKPGYMSRALYIVLLYNITKHTGVESLFSQKLVDRYLV